MYVAGLKNETSIIRNRPHLPNRRKYIVTLSYDFYKNQYTLKTFNTKLRFSENFQYFLMGQKFEKIKHMKVI